MAEDKRTIVKKLDDAADKISSFLDQIEPACTDAELREIDKAIMDVRHVSAHLGEVKDGLLEIIATCREDTDESQE